MNEIWEKIKNQIKEELYYKDAKDEYILWISQIKYLRTEGSTIFLGAPSAFIKNQMKRRCYLNMIQKKINEYTNKDLSVEIEV